MRNTIQRMQNEILEERKDCTKVVQLQCQKMNPVRPRRVILILSKDSIIERLQRDYQVSQVDNLTSSVTATKVDHSHWIQYATVRKIRNTGGNSEEKWRQPTSVVDVRGRFLFLVFLVLVFIVLMHKDFMKAGYKNADATVILIVQMVKKAKVSKLKSIQTGNKVSGLLRLNR